MPKVLFRGSRSFMPHSSEFTLPALYAGDANGPMETSAASTDAAARRPQSCHSLFVQHCCGLEVCNADFVGI